ncbi:MAG: metallophosphoesterase [Oscillospiraceae bacterium]|nr:metallophosphoesterase [Oscillospiraceae bacterium]
MHQKAVVRRVSFPAGRRILVISDVHGHLAFLQGVLKKANFSKNDILILLGDLIEKGPDSLATLRYVMALSKTHTVFNIAGNCDNLVWQFTEDTAPKHESVYRHFLRHWGERSILLQMARAAGMSPTEAEDFPALRALIVSQYADELSFLREMPTILLSDKFLFVHGGVPREDHLEELDAWHCMKYDNFRGQGHVFRRWCIVGHWPVTLYNREIPSANPIVDRDAHIISIDGGCVLKLDGQLNALVIPDGQNEDFSVIAYDGLPTAVALDAQQASEHSINIRWGEHNVTVLEQGDEVSLCRHDASGYQLKILNSYLYRMDGTVKCEDSTDYRLPIEPGDIVSVVAHTSRATLIKKGGVTGWYFGRLSEH